MNVCSIYYMGINEIPYLGKYVHIYICMYVDIKLVYLCEYEMAAYHINIFSCTFHFVALHAHSFS